MRPLVGRGMELRFMLTRAEKVSRMEGGGGVIVVEGDTGMGKTKLISEVRHCLKQYSLEALATGQVRSRAVQRQSASTLT